MASMPIANDQADEDLEAVLANYLRAAEEGRAPERMELLARHPDLAPELAAFFAGQERFTRLAAPLRDAVSAAQQSTIEDKLTEGGRLGDFHLRREVGRGGMGIVYEAEQISLGRKVALKILPFAGALDAKQLQRFKNEAHAAAHLQHQNIVPVYFVGCERGVHFYAMQFVEGQTLAALIQELRQSLSGGRQPPEPESQRASKIEDRGSASRFDPQLTGPYTPDARVARPESSKGVIENLAHPATPFEDSGRATQQNVTVEDRGALSETVSAPSRSSILDSGSSFFRTVANLGIQAAEALEHAHQLGVIHRDIKPANLIIEPLSLAGERGRGEGAVATGVRLWITDFGLAHCQGGCELTMSGDLLGTLRYMSPEQALAKRVIVDERTDIYSLGVTLYELLTLEAAFPGTDRQEVLRQIAFDDPKPPRRFNKAIPMELETIILKAMEKNPVDRYGSAKELAEDLQHFLDDKPIRARRPTLVQRFRKWTRRHPGVIRTAIGALLSAVLILAIGTVWIAQAERNERAERKRAELAEGDATTNLQKALNAEGEKTDKLWREKLARAEALRRSGRAGRRFDSLKALTEATQIARSLNVGEEDILKLRNEAIACMTLLDLQIQPEYDRSVSVPAGSTRVWGDAQFERYATSDDQGNLVIRRIHGDQEILRLKVPGSRPRVLHFSPDGRFLAGVYGGRSISRPGHVIVWELLRAEVAFESPTEFVDFPFGRVRWSPDSRRLAVLDSSDFIAIIDVVLRKEIQRFPAKVTRGEFAFHPNGKQLAVLGPPLPDAEKQGFGSIKPVLWLPAFGPEILNRFRHGWGSPDGASVQIRDVETGALVDQFALPVPVLHFDWGCDGRFIAGDYMFFPPDGINNNVYVWDVAERRMRHVLRAHRDDTTNAAFNHAGDLLATHGVDHTLRLWNPWTGKELLSAESGEGVPEFSPDDRFLLIHENWTNIRRFWRIARSGVYRQLYSPKDSTLSVANVAFSPDGRWLAASCNDGVRLWDVATPRHVAWLSPGNNVSWSANKDSFSFEANGKAIVTRGLVGDFRWPLSFEEDQTSRRLRIGPPEPLGRTRLMSGFGRIGRLPASAGSHVDRPSARGDQGVRSNQGGTLQAILRSWREPELVERAASHKLASLTSPEPMRLECFAFNPDGTQLAIAGLGNGIELWDLRCIREQLVKMGLDWQLPPFPLATNSEISKPLEVQMQAGHMADREKYSLVIAMFPFHAEGYYQRGMAFVKFGQLAEASADLSMAIMLKPDHAEAYYRHGLIHLWADRRREAEADFSRAIAIRPDNAEAYAARANSNLMLAEYPSAVADFSKAIELSGWDKAYDDWRKTDGPFPASKLSGRFCHALAQLAARDHVGYRRVCAALFDRLAQSPDPGTAFLAAWICIVGPDALIDPSCIVRLAEKPLESGARDFDWLAVLGAAHYRAGNFSEALQRLREAYATAGDGQHASRKGLELLFLAMTHARLGHQQEAREWLEKALPLEKPIREDLPWHLYLTFVLLRDEAEALVLGPEAVADDRRRYAADDPRLAYTLACLGGTLLRTHQPAEAEKILRECLAIRKKKEPDAWTTFHAQSLLGEALVAQKDYAEGEPLLMQGFEGLSQREPKIPAHVRQVRMTEALKRLVQLYEACEKPEQADQWRKKLEAHKLKIGPELPPLQKEKEHSSRRTQ